MSFGAPTAIEVAVSGPDFTKTRPFAQQLQKALGEVSSLRDLEFEQELDYPAVRVDIDRALAGMLGVTAGQVGQRSEERRVGEEGREGVAGVARRIERGRSGARGADEERY